jgi:hypothetical protein
MDQRRKKILLGTFGPVFAAGLTAFLDSDGIQGTADNVIPDAGQIFNPASADHDHRVFLEVMPFAGDVGSNFHGIGQTDPGHFPQSGIGLFRSSRIDPDADPPLLGTTLQGRNSIFLQLGLAAFANKLINSRHVLPNVKKLNLRAFFLLPQKKGTKNTFTRP